MSRRLFSVLHVACAAVLALAGSACARASAPQFAPPPNAPPPIELVPSTPRHRPQVPDRHTAPRTGPDSVIAAYQLRLQIAEADLQQAIVLEDSARVLLDRHRASRPSAPAALMTGPALQAAFQAEQQWQQRLHQFELRATERHAATTAARVRLENLVAAPPQDAPSPRDGKRWQDQRGRDPLVRPPESAPTPRSGAVSRPPLA